MQVASQIKSNSAVIGSQNTAEFSISASAEFFQLLSSNLYKNPEQAMIREIICNAWDANVDNNKPIEDVEINYDDNFFVVKDQGKGIADEDMVDIYCTYGNSTKIYSDNQTGGFGLGCKSPFACVDNFIVESCHNGTKTIYNLKKASVSTGKPTLFKMAQMPTEDTGLTVRIPYGLREEGYLNTLIDISKIKFDKVYIDIPHYLPDRVYVYYGRVFYPVDYKYIISENKAFRDLTLYTVQTSATIILKAEPNTLELTPSREALHYSKKTINTLIGLADNLMSKEAYYNEQAKKRILEECYYNPYPSVDHIEGLINKSCVDDEGMIEVYAKYMIRNFGADSSQRLFATKDMGKGLGYSYIKNVLDSKTWGQPKKWYFKHFFNKILNNLKPRHSLSLYYKSMGNWKLHNYKKFDTSYECYNFYKAKILLTNFLVSNIRSYFYSKPTSFYYVIKCNKKDSEYYHQVFSKYEIEEAFEEKEKKKPKLEEKKPLGFCVYGSEGIRAATNGWKHFISFGNPDHTDYTGVFKAVYLLSNGNCKRKDNDELGLMFSNRKNGCIEDLYADKILVCNRISDYLKFRKTFPNVPTLKELIEKEYKEFDTPVNRLEISLSNSNILSILYNEDIPVSEFFHDFDREQQAKIIGLIEPKYLNYTEALSPNAYKLFLFNRFFSKPYINTRYSKKIIKWFYRNSKILKYIKYPKSFYNDKEDNENVYRLILKFTGLQTNEDYRNRNPRDKYHHIYG